MKGNCEVFDKEKCTGCEGLIYDIDMLKLKCETYQQYMKKFSEGEQVEWKILK